MTTALPVRDFVDAATLRFIPTAYIDAPALAPLADDADALDILAQVEMLTSSRHMQMMPLPSGISAQELVMPDSRPGWSYINAAFCYTRPGGNRFNDATRGAWYAAYGPCARETGLAEITFHLERELANTGVWENTTSYGAILAGFMAPFHDMTAQPDHPALSPDITAGYPAGQALARTLRAKGAQGLLYPSVRHDGGTCLAAFHPSLVQNVRQAETVTLSWTGGPGPEVSD